jgi:hypothetical protein
MYKVATPKTASILLILSVILNSIGLIFLRSKSQSIDQGMFIVMVGFSLSTPLLGLSSSKLSREHSRTKAESSSASTGTLIIWAFSMLVIYWIYFNFPATLSLPQIIVAQSVVPIAAVYLSGDYRRRPKGDTPWKMAALCLLLAIAASEWKTNSKQQLIVFTILCCAFLTAQTMLRLTLRSYSPLGAHARLSTAIALEVAAYSCITQTPLITRYSVVNGLEFGMLILAIQFGYLTGIRNTPPIASALLLSCAVPISICVQAIWTGNQPTLIQSALGGFYMVTMIAFSLKKTELS